jgi:hypothetical protein
MQWDGEEKCYLMETGTVSSQRVLESPLNAAGQSTSTA